MRSKAAWLGILGCMACTLLGTAAPAKAGIDVDLGIAAPLGDSGRLFLNISSRYFDMEPRAVSRWHSAYSNPDDLTVALFISSRSGRDPEVIFSLRQHGLSWWDIGLRCGVPTDAWFVPVARDPGPPYGKAYGYWKKYRANPKRAFILRDPDVRNLVAVRMAHEYYGVPAEMAMDWRRSGRNVRDVMVTEYQKRHLGTEKAAYRDDDRGSGGKDHGDHGKGHGKKK